MCPHTVAGSSRWIGTTHAPLLISPRQMKEVLSMARKLCPVSRMSYLFELHPRCPSSPPLPLNRCKRC